MLTINSMGYMHFAHVDKIFPHWGKQILSTPNKLEDGVLILHGGADISPRCYGQNPGRYTGAGVGLSLRDRQEMEAIEQAVARKIPILGICRGAQLLTAFAGGTLYQHVTNHAGGNHQVTTKDGEVFHVTSAHHQMCNLTNVKHELLAWSSNRLSNCYMGENDEDLPAPEKEPEIFLLPEINAIAIQGHPEWMAENSRGVKYTLELVKDQVTQLYGVQ